MLVFVCLLCKVIHCMYLDSHNLCTVMSRVAALCSHDACQSAMRDPDTPVCMSCSRLFTASGVRGLCSVSASTGTKCSDWAWLQYESSQSFV